MPLNNLFNFCFEVTPRCNHSCQFCYNIWKENPEYPRGELTLEQIQHLFDRTLFGIPTQSIHLSGGEPLLRNDLEDIVAYFKRKKLHIGLSTNGTLLTKDRALSLKQAGVQWFDITVLSHQEESHNRLCENPNGYRLACDAVRHAKEAGALVAAAFTATSLNIDDLIPVYHQSREMGADKLALYRFVPTGAGQMNQSKLLPTRSQINTAINQLDQAVGDHQFPVMVGIPFNPCELDVWPTHIKLSPCLGGISKFTIDPLGNLRICEQSPQIIGSLMRESFFFKPFSRPVRNFIRFLPEKCRPCKHKKICRGGCRFLKTETAG